VVKATICMLKREHELWRRQVASEPDYNAVDRPLTFHLDPVSSTSSDIRAIRSLRDHAFDAGQRQPSLGQLNLIRLID
jgi:hypothetical protein